MAEKRYEPGRERVGFGVCSSHVLSGMSAPILVSASWPAFDAMRRALPESTREKNLWEKLRNG